MQQYLRHTKILLFIVSCMIPGVVTSDENESCLSRVDTDLCDIDLEERECGGLSGWEIYDNDSIAGLEEGMCNIEKVSSITNERFLLEYAFEKPVIFVNVSDNSMFQKLCTKTALLARYSENNVTVSTANTHSYKKVHMTFKQYLLNGMKSQSVNKLGKDTLYFFGDNNHTEWSELFDMYQPPPYTLPETSAVYSFGVAGSGTGVPFHFHGPGFAEVIHGAKRWFLYPYDKQPRFDPNENVLNWVLKNYPQLAVEDKPVECTLKPNEVLYFPDRWWHSTLNLKASVFISTFLDSVICNHTNGPTKFVFIICPALSTFVQNTMFARPFRTKSNVAIKGSDRKRLRSDLRRCFGDSLSMEQVQQIVPNKEEMTVMKLYSHKGENVAVYCVKKQPVLFEHEKTLYPSIYTVWKYPQMLAYFTTHTPVFEKLHNGADLMLPGVEISKDGLPIVQKNEVVAINVTDNQAALAVGSTLLSSRDMVEVAGMKGKGVAVIHTFGDHLWMTGDKQEPPTIPIPAGHFLKDPPEKIDPRTSGDNCSESAENDHDIVAGIDEDDSIQGPDISELHIEEPIEDTGQQVEGNRSELEMMEELLHRCFMTALKKKLKDTELPILTSTFYRTYVLACCPADASLDIKKTSFKKVGKYLKQVESDGIIQTKELTKGNDHIVGVCRSHPTLKSFTDFVLDTEKESVVSAPNTISSYGIVTQKHYEPPEMSVVHCVSAATQALFKEFGYKKGDAVPLNEVRSQITNYVKRNELLVANQPRMVTLDPLLHRAMYDKGNNNVLHASWEDVFKRVISKMQACHQLQFKGLAPIIRTGGPPSIQINVQQRAGNKKVTIVHNLESFMITPSQFAESMRKKAQASTSVSDMAGAANKTMQQVLIQGNQVSLVESLLTGNEYNIPRKYLKGLENAPKSKKKRQIA